MKLGKLWQTNKEGGPCTGRKEARFDLIRRIPVLKRVHVLLNKSLGLFFDISAQCFSFLK